MLYCNAVCVAVVRVPVRSMNASLMLTTMMFCRFWMSRVVSIISSRRKPSRHCVRFTASSRPLVFAMFQLVITRAQPVIAIAMFQPAITRSRNLS